MIIKCSDNETLCYHENCTVLAKYWFKMFKNCMTALIFPSFFIVSHSFYLLLYRFSRLFRQYINHRLFRPIK